MMSLDVGLVSGSVSLSVDMVNEGLAVVDADADAAAAVCEFLYAEFGTRPE